MRLPRIGETITTERARELCAHFGCTYLLERIDSAPETFKDWAFDGASMIPDALVSKLAGIPNLTEIALKHDLKYGYGEPGNESERENADQEFKADLLADGADRIVAEVMYQAVRTFGNPPISTSFSWGFARRK